MGKHIYEDYDQEPVTYCARCYSLKIVHEDSIDTDCCMDCGSTELLTTDIHTWETLYETRYGHKFTEKHDDPRNSIIFKMPLNKLKVFIYQNIPLAAIVYRLYPKFPQGMSKVDTILMLFDKLAKDNRFDDLRFLLYDYVRKHKEELRQENENN